MKKWLSDLLRQADRGFKDLHSIAKSLERIADTLDTLDAMRDEQYREHERQRL